MNRKIIVRNAVDDFYAFLTAQGMEDAGATVFSISYDGQHQQQGALIPCSKFIVWASYADPTTPDEIDSAIEFSIEQAIKRSVE